MSKRSHHTTIRVCILYVAYCPLSITLLVVRNSYITGMRDVWHRKWNDTPCRTVASLDDLTVECRYFVENHCRFDKTS